MTITAAQIRATRRRFGDSQITFARRIGVNQATLSRWENRGLSSVTLQITGAINAIVALTGKAARRRCPR